MIYSQNFTGWPSKRHSGKRNTKYSQILAFLLAGCVEEILSTVWKVIYEQFPEVFIAPDPEDFVPSLSIPTENLYFLKIRSQRATKFVFMVTVWMHCLYVKQNVLEMLICGWIIFPWLLCWVRMMAWELICTNVSLPCIHHCNLLKSDVRSRNQ